MAEELTYKHLRDLAREEKAQAGLVKLPRDFHQSVSGFLASKFAQAEENRQILQMREFENAVALVREITAVRQQKILFRAIRSRGVHGDAGDMTNGEHELYDRFCAVLADENRRLEDELAKYGKSERAPEGKAGANGGSAAEEPEGGKLKKVRFKKDIPAYIGMNKEKIGPFRPGEEGFLPPQEAELLLRENLAEAAE